ncbi:uncharacterized protein RCH25_036349, partial [Pelodytes ibericus]
FVDGSRYADDKGKFHTGMAVTSEHEVLCARQLRPDQSAQEAELIALTEACLIAKEPTANIYTDSRYAFGVVHDFGVIWKARDYITAAGTPIKNASAVAALMAAVLLPTQVAVIKVKAHTLADTPEAKGNVLADQAAKKAAVEVSSIPDPNSLEGSHTLSPGEWVEVKKHVRGTLDPRYERPYQVLLTTPTSLKLEGRPTWIHASHCKRIKCPPPPD